MDAIEGAHARRRAIADAALSWIESVSLPLAIVDAENRLLWSNNAGIELLAAGHGLELRNGILIASDASLLEEFRAAIHDSLADVSSWCVGRPDGDGWLIVRAQRLQVKSPALIALTLILAPRRQHAIYEHLDTAFGLTKAEHRVLHDLLNGNEADSLAKLHGVTIETTRSHIRSIYSKLEVNSREQLFARVQAFRAWF